MDEEEASTLLPGVESLLSQLTTLGQVRACLHSTRGRSRASPHCLITAS
jgi:hypothetical protein